MPTASRPSISSKLQRNPMRRAFAPASWFSASCSLSQSKEQLALNHDAGANARRIGFLCNLDEMLGRDAVGITHHVGNDIGVEQVLFAHSSMSSSGKSPSSTLG